MLRNIDMLNLSSVCTRWLAIKEDDELKAEGYYFVNGYLATQYGIWTAKQMKVWHAGGNIKERRDFMEICCKHQGTVV